MLWNNIGETLISVFVNVAATSDQVLFGSKNILLLRSKKYWITKIVAY